MKYKSPLIIFSIIALVSIIAVPIVIFSISLNSASEFINESHRTGPYRNKPELVYHSWDWQWGSNIILVRYVDKENVLSDSFGEYRNGVTWSLKKFSPSQGRFTVDAVKQ